MAMATSSSFGASLSRVSTWKPTFSARLASQKSTLRLFPISSEMHLSSGPVVSASPPQKKVLVPIGFGNEEIEVVVLVDILRRAGADVLVASVEEKLQVEFSRRVKMVADTHISSCDEEKFDLIALPGGMPGSARLQECQLLKKMTIEQAEQQKLVGAISTSPAFPLLEWGVLEARMATCHPGFTDKLSPTFMTKAKVQTDGCVTTSRGPGTVFDFALSFVEQLYGEEKRNEVLKPLVLPSRNQQETLKSEFNPLNWKAAAVPQVLVPVATGSEEMEAIIIIDVLRRANMKVVVASVEEDLQIEASRKVRIVADKRIEDVKDSCFDIIVLPGGMPGAEKLHNCKTLKKILQRQVKEQRPIGAICAAPAVILEANGWLKGKKATCHPTFAEKLSKRRLVKSRVVLDGYTITSQGPGTAMEFALCIVDKFFGKERARNIANGLVFEYP
ncbi:hypothetical protein GOP47_0015851 [Adiantum capillus-veneris]|uniref:DJ-1/PfpI domain-containing protein n=1 Tax=Adiantum capillus-veneris TaxID=13818 RepID=A0A9D4ZDL3_ADICA|nr:hypothetical protein GOP47_0015851 [Adiantum capillus-veneris]